ncbi:hypothetical protein PUN4_990064 [Paraburkholderia unamae]|nr:hypothetical protein PUN4_990064 [Paraburkholderia unamae]
MRSHRTELYSSSPVVSTNVWRAFDWLVAIGLVCVTRRQRDLRPLRYGLCFVAPYRLENAA